MIYLTHAKRPELNQEVLSFDQDRHILVGRRADGTVITDPCFHVDIAKRCGYKLTQQKPDKF